MFELSGNRVQIESLANTVLSQIAVFADEQGNMYQAYELIDVDEDTMMMKVDTNNLTPESRQLLLTVLYYRFKDNTLTNTIRKNFEIPQPADNHFRLTVNVKDYEKFVEEYFIYNSISNEQFTALVYPLSLDMGINKAELIAINLTEAQMKLLGKQAKTQVVAKKVGAKIDTISSTLTATSKIAMQEVVNPLAVAATKVGTTVASGLATTAVDCALTAIAEVAKDASNFSLNELKKRDDVQIINYSIRKMLNKGQQASTKSSNNFSF